MTLGSTGTCTRTRGRAWARSTAAAVFILGWATSASAQPSTTWTDYTALAGHQLVIGLNIDVFGNFGVIEPSGNPNIDNLELETNTYHLTASPPPDDAYLASDRIVLQNNASANDVFTNDVKTFGDGNVRGTITPFAFPLQIVLPP